MSRTRAILIVLSVALILSAPGALRGGDASQSIVAAADSTPVQYQPTPDVETKAAGAAMRRANRAARYQAWYDAAAQAELEHRAALLRAEAARIEEARQARARAAAAPPPAPRVSAPARVGSCGGWESLIAAYFPNEVAKACSVMMCESRGNPTVHNSRSTASGLWQFLDSTWKSVTGTPGPAANYSPDTQTAAAAKLRNSSGWSPWSCA